MKRCTHLGCGGILLSEPAEDAYVGPPNPDRPRTHLVCMLCQRSPKPPEATMPLVRADRFRPTTTIPKTGTNE